MDLAKARIALTGGAGFLGGYVRAALEARGARELFAPRSKDYDLREQEGVRRFFDDGRPDLVIHLAASVGGIGANSENPGKFFYDNLMMGALVLEEARRRETAKTVVLGTICAYPKFAHIPFKEDALWDGYPEETNAPYGVAKKALLVMAQGYRAQYGTNAIYLLPVNLYGPRDNFDPRSSHVIPALIRKFVDAEARAEREVIVWGDGSPTREFLHAKDAAEGIALAAERYDGDEPVNLGAGFEISIKDLAETIARLTGYTGALKWDTSKPNGQPRRSLDTTRAERLFGFKARIGFEQGLRETIAWYREQGRG